MKSNVWDKPWSDTSNHEWWERPTPEVVEFIECLLLRLDWIEGRLARMSNGFLFRTQRVMSLNIPFKDTASRVYGRRSSQTLDVAQQGFEVHMYIADHAMVAFCKPQESFVYLPSP